MTLNDTPSELHTRIKSFVLRQGRLTQAQEQALRELWPHYGLDAQQALDPLKTFGRAAPLTLEIGFGNGESLARMAAEAPERDFIGVEVHRPGVGHLLLQLHERQLNNVRIFCADAVEVMNRVIADASLAGLQVFFPDPWPKKRHHKRRLINTEFVALASQKLEAGGLFHCATDWEDYAVQMLDVLGENPALRNLAGQGQYSPRPDYRPLTKFESRGHGLGHGVWDLLFVRL
ncbi:tRNA (guanosine(46)-N7)-methyltransferase TrmB [Methylococcus sp. EFPC2]|uniref:tRNA (guanosine(46)-N7)-methyltransferase TrmB n=1 Tax=Methylococcus sp. EFPC2 TaxID=2812648 RepID=UPI001966EFD4|nr:tRNA (guanosine(46)-N7)-methyltransferase TrmB [Methylococcus sp. EFPC2]QSA96156.1 tRNA (guanosine(46)-N7)-methyltransferase TrmB [Methylococcus sp. EFPC2]